MKCWKKKPAKTHRSIPGVPSSPAIPGGSLAACGEPYHIGQRIESGCSKDEIVEAMSVALVVGGTIVIPHMRRAIEFMDEMLAEK